MYATSNVFSNRLRFVAFCVYLLVLLSGVHLGANKKTVDQTKGRAWNKLTGSLAFDEIALKGIHNAGESPLSAHSENSSRSSLLDRTLS